MSDKVRLIISVVMIGPGIIFGVVWLTLSRMLQLGLHRISNPDPNDYAVSLHCKSIIIL